MKVAIQAGYETCGPLARYFSEGPGVPLRLGQWQRDGERRALQVPGPDLDGAAVAGDDRRDYREAEPGALDLADPGGRGTEEPLEQGALLLGRDADAGVTDRDHRLAVDDVDTEADRPAVLGELHRIAEQVDHHPLEL